MKKLLAPVRTFLTLFVLNGLRAWIVLIAAVFSIALLKAVPSAWRDREWLDVVLLAALGVLLLVVSYRWFAARWIDALSRDSDS